jgi:uncharacterized membrane protein
MKINEFLSNKNMLLLFLLNASIVWIFIILAAPIMRSSEITFLNRISEYLYFIFEPVCHQIPERSILINSEPLAVCSRCFAAYVGGFLLILLITLKKKPIHYNLNMILFLFAPAVIDFLSEQCGLYSDILIIRIITGLMLGVGISYLIVFSITDSQNIYLINWKSNNGKPEIN